VRVQTVRIRQTFLITLKSRLTAFAWLARIWRCHTDHLLTLCRSPTLLYTQRLEQKVAQLEAALSEAQTSPNVSQSYPSQSESSEAGESSTIDNDTRVSLNESISLFQLPGSIRTLALANDQAEQELAAGKQSLVNNAWRERAYERLADIPVGIQIDYK
jgi:hypothetical protein